MNTLKSRIFNYLTSYQKSDICRFISNFVKKHFDKTTDEILNLFIEEEEYYLKINSSMRAWIANYLEEEQFHKDLILYIQENQRKYKFKEKQEEFKEKQKIFQKELRKTIKDKKMSKQLPTKKQISYYKALCKKYNINIVIDLEKSSKLELKNSIEALLNEKNKSSKENVLLKLNEIIKFKKD
ncbi:MAG: hypothetical protein V2B14_01950 [bacterium]